MDVESSYAATVITLVAHDARLGLPLLALLSLLGWRLYTFTILPWLYPNDPKEYPYWIPGLGHLRSFFKDSNKLLSDARLYFHDSREPFALTVAGQKWYVLLRPEDVTSTYKMDESSLSYDIFAVEVMRMVGITEEGVRKAFQTQPVEKYGAQTAATPYKHLVRLCKEYQLVQLSPGPRLDRLLGQAIGQFNLRLDLQSIRTWGAGWYANSTTSAPGSVDVSLYNWVSDVFIDFGTRAYFGDLLQDIAPDITRTFMAFDALSWQAMYQYPSFLCGEMTRAKGKLQNAMAEYFASPKDQREDISWFISKVEEEMDRLDIAASDRAIFFFQLYWRYVPFSSISRLCKEKKKKKITPLTVPSINGNTRKAPFWMLSHLLFNPTLLDLIRAETEPAISKNGIDLSHLLNTQTCPHLNSVWDETIRLAAYAASVRFLARDLQLGGKTLRKGNRLMMPQRQLHFSEEAFGADAAAFHPDRFLEDPALRRHPCLRPFGGGASMCPGRNLAKQATLAFVAMAVRRFEMVVEPPGQPFPEAAEGKPSIGLVDVQEGYDLKVRLRAR
ncbi:cytochrome P450 [Sodiomyces alkalinus F11]|uniref:Cytochrome P450 n=1 Tax=Sodiomyces alkalinus (strain CBS 110278 / VKM F-3762 / F11) TaxID=1314773 RepID=A0A3N2PTJ4_SODAK|nr:cytochrome P450 [Sodiomyces alkalinus F11]ROT37825.1 cytochrome P450 [Sodiomyces alkalinus F11]